MRIEITRPRLILVLAFSLALFAFVLGVAFPPARPDSGTVVRPSVAGAAADSSTADSEARLLVSEFADQRSTLWLVDADAPDERQEFLTIDHAAGWEISGAVSPEGMRLAYVVLPPGRQEPKLNGQ